MNKRRLCDCGCFGRHTLDTAFQVLACSFRALLSVRYPRHDHKGELFAPSSWRGKGGGTELAHPRGVPRQDRRLGLAEASRRPERVE